MAEEVTIQTTDGIIIAANLYSADEEPTKFAIFLHMMPAKKESWTEFAEVLGRLGYMSIAIDMRGHGESTKGGELNYKEFTDEEHQAKILDAEAAFEYLKEFGATEENTVIIGASIGANLAIQFLSETAGMQKAVALSPGNMYRGIDAKRFVQQLDDDQKLLMVASDEDEFSFESMKEMHDLAPDTTDTIEESGLGHGTSMFDVKSELLDEVIEWMEK